MRESYVIGTSDYYESIHRGNGYQPLQKGQDTMSFPYDVGVKLDVVGGRFWVIQKAGTIFVKENGKIIKRYDCSNKISGFCYLPQPQPEEKKVSEKKKEVVKKSITELKIEFNNNSKNTFIFNDTSAIPDYSAFNPLSFRNLAWEIPVVGIIVWGIVELVEALRPHQEIRLSGGGTFWAN